MDDLTERDDLDGDRVVVALPTLLEAYRASLETTFLIKQLMILAGYNFEVEIEEKKEKII